MSYTLAAVLHQPRVTHAHRDKSPTTSKLTIAGMCLMNLKRCCGAGAGHFAARLVSDTPYPYPKCVCVGELVDSGGELSTRLSSSLPPAVRALRTCLWVQRSKSVILPYMRALAHSSGRNYFAIRPSLTPELRLFDTHTNINAEVAALAVELRSNTRAHYLDQHPTFWCIFLVTAVSAQVCDKSILMLVCY